MLCDLGSGAFDACIENAYPLRWYAAGVLIVAVLIDLVDLTIVNVALPTIRADPHASGGQLE